MSEWKLVLLPEADKELGALDLAVQAQVRKGLLKVSANPLPDSEGGYGKPLRNGSKTRLAGLCKLKFKRINVRVVYKPVRTEQEMLVIVVGVRTDDEVYRIADTRRKKHGI
ncbi:addiction module toxin RelE [Bifidobacterium rousetti]|uniref:type II toxin-antitoxin system RelE family toxin n=1 Tax=Bifidobacterium rousetti TaxID=2045439 RepID=UPI00123A98E7|nr:type II toxin-antitoxin system RelE/ParE family toxin [Bifidobacterium rousetti]KAA8815706.1 addiction module toxin RelE [Bifidobacterium rousetti]